MRFLDLYAGSGAVGLEALSRGAAYALLAERAPAALSALRANVTALGLPGAHIHAGQVASLLAGIAPVAYDVVFLDPPYADPVDADLAALSRRGWLAPAACVVVERSSRGSPPTWPQQITVSRARRYGEATLWYGRAP